MAAGEAPPRRRPGSPRLRRRRRHRTRRAHRGRRRRHRLSAWFARLITQPAAGEPDAWNPQELDYRFSAAAPEPGGTEKVYTAGDYVQGRLDWYSPDVDADSADLSVPASLTPVPATRTTVLVPVTFAGRANTRWWAFEDAKTNYGDAGAAGADLAKLMFLEFALVYANDWSVIPWTLPDGMVASVRGVAVTDVFGERLWISSANNGAGAAWQRWGMFTVGVTGGTTPDATDADLVLLPSAAKIDQSPPTEDVQLIRDEIANMVYGVETSVPLATGEVGRGLEQALLLRAFLQAQVPADGPAPAVAAPIRYQVMTAVPENWIPFLPVRVDGSNREIQLQRAAMPRILDGAATPPAKIQPRTVLLREGLDRTPVETYFVHEEDVPRAGTRLFQAFARTRWSDGSVHVWQRVRRQTGRGEGSSGLAFDVAADSLVGS